LGTAFPDDAATALLVDSLNADRLLVGMNAAVRLTPDAGATWSQVLAVGSPGFVSGLKVLDSVVVAIMDRQGAVPPATSLGVYLGSNRATTWDTVPTPPGAAGGTELTIRDDGLAFIGTRSGVWVVKLR
jgi:hypothetical protein